MKFGLMLPNKGRPNGDAGVMKKIRLSSLALLILSSCASFQTRSKTVPVSTNESNAGVANPAAIYCEERGYKTEIRTTYDGSQFGVCIFPDGSECEEWAFLSGKCEYNSSVVGSPTVEHFTACAAEKTDESAEPQAVTITHLGNSGFLIAAGEKKILIDGIPERSILEAQLSSETVESLLSAQAPFDEVDLILVTHSHWDHFSAENTVSYMNANLKANLVSTVEVANAMLAVDKSLSERVIPVRLNRRECRQMAISDINLQAIYLSHGSQPGAVENFGFILMSSGVSLFHTGDMDPDAVWLSLLQSYGIHDLDLDVAFLPEYMLTTSTYHERVREGIHADYLIPMHYMAKPSLEVQMDIQTAFPDTVFLLEGMDSWIIP